MIKIIISHDVDHLFAADHWFRDLLYPKMWVRTTLQLIKKEISCKEWWLRNISCFKKDRHNIEALMDYDEKHGIPSTFFFGMNQGLGMSYKPEEAGPMVQRVHERGFAVGVHGVEYQDLAGMKKEYNTFKRVTGLEPCGIRIHYVRFDESTFEKLDDIGYAFDSTEFEKANKGSRKNPYQVGNMWEFPLAIMDTYLPQSFEDARRSTIELLNQCKEKKLNYITVLFHDCHFCEDYLVLKKWYKWLMEYFEDSSEFDFSSYKTAILELCVQQDKTI